MILRMMKLAVFPLLCWLLACGCGQKVDGSKFTSARLMGDGQTVAYCAQRLVYRRASGMAAYPDGGMANYLDDAAVCGLYDLREKRVRATVEWQNREWEPGQGAASIVDASIGWLLLRQGGQRRGASSGGTVHRLLHGDMLNELPLDLDARLQAGGLTLEEAHLTDNRGTLAAVVTAATGGTQIHVRLADGTWRAPLAGQYYGTQNGEIFVWQGGQRLLVYDPLADARRTVPANAQPPLPDATTGVNHANDRLEYGIRTDSGWQYTPLGLTLAEAL